MAIQHSAITDPDIHEPKGITTAVSKQVYIADGSGSGNWTTLSTSQLNDLNVTSPVDGQALVYDATTSKWVNDTITATTPSSGATVINVKDSAYGAKGDGTTDDTAAIVAAYGAIPASGGVLYFPAGTYMLQGNSLRVKKSSVVIRGDGPGVSILKLVDSPSADQGHIIIFGEYNDESVRGTLSNMRLEHIELDGNRANQYLGAGANGGWRIEDVTDVVGYNVWIHDCDGYNFTHVGSFIANRARWFLRDCKSYDSAYDGYDIKAGLDTYHFENCTADGCGTGVGDNPNERDSMGFDLRGRNGTLVNCRAGYLTANTSGNFRIRENAEDNIRLIHCSSYNAPVGACGYFIIGNNTAVYDLIGCYSQDDDIAIKHRRGNLNIIGGEIKDSVRLAIQNTKNFRSNVVDNNDSDGNGSATSSFTMSAGSVSFNVDLYNDTYICPHHRILVSDGNHTCEGEVTAIGGTTSPQNVTFTIDRISKGSDGDTMASGGIVTTIAEALDVIAAGQSFTAEVASAASLYVDQRLRIHVTGNTSVYMDVIVTNISGTDVTFEVTRAVGVGTHSGWDVDTVATVTIFDQVVGKTKSTFSVALGTIDIDIAKEGSYHFINQGPGAILEIGDGTRAVECVLNSISSVDSTTGRWNVTITRVILGSGTMASGAVATEPSMGTLYASGTRIYQCGVSGATDAVQVDYDSYPISLHGVIIEQSGRYGLLVNNTRASVVGGAIKNNGKSTSDKFAVLLREQAVPAVFRDVFLGDDSPVPEQDAGVAVDDFATPGSTTGDLIFDTCDFTGNTASAVHGTGRSKVTLRNCLPNLETNILSVFPREPVYAYIDNYNLAGNTGAVLFSPRLRQNGGRVVCTRMWGVIADTNGTISSQATISAGAASSYNNMVGNVALSLTGGSNDELFEITPDSTSFVTTSNAQYGFELVTAATGTPADITTSTTSNDIAGSGNKTWTVASTSGLSTGQDVRVYNTGSPTNYMTGEITSIDGSDVTVAVDGSNGSGTGITTWTFRDKDFRLYVDIIGEFLFRPA